MISESLKNKLVAWLRGYGNNIFLSGKPIDGLEFYTEFLTENGFNVCTYDNNKLHHNPYILVSVNIVIGDHGGYITAAQDTSYRFLGELPTLYMTEELYELNLFGLGHTHIFVCKNDNIDSINNVDDTIINDNMVATSENRRETIARTYPIMEREDVFVMPILDFDYHREQPWLLGMPLPMQIKMIKNIFEMGYKKIVFDHEQESCTYPLITYVHILTLQFKDTHPEAFCFLCMDAHVNKIYHELYKYNNINFTMASSCVFLSVLQYTSANNGIWQPYFNQPYQVKIKPKKYLCYNRNPRAHRTRIIYHMLTNNYDGYISAFLTEENFPLNEKHISEYVREQLPLIIDVETYDEPDGRCPYDVHEADLQHSKTSYISISNETYFYNDSSSPESGLFKSFPDSLFITEKTFKPILMRQPFIIVGQPGILAELRALGFKTFDGIIDETYDSIFNGTERMNAILHEIDRLMQFSDTEWLTFQEKARDIINYNAEYYMQCSLETPTIYAEIDFNESRTN